VILHGLIPFRKMTDTLLAGDTLTALYGFAVDNFISSLSQTTVAGDGRQTSSDSK